MVYMGSKSRITKYIVPIIQSYIDNNNITTYIEPFVGGGNVIDKIVCDNKIGSDINKYLIALLNRAKLNLPLYDCVPKELYDKARKSFYNQTNDFEDWQIGNIGFLASYGGRFFDGGYARQIYAKTKTGLRFRNYYNENKNGLLKQSQNDNFKKCDFRYCDYRDYTGITNCLLYLDPPYQTAKKYLNSKNFDYDSFWQWCKDMSENNIVIISELQAPDDFVCIWEKPVVRTMNSNAINKKATEKLFIYKKEK